MKISTVLVYLQAMLIPLTLAAAASSPGNSSRQLIERLKQYGIPSGQIDILISASSRLNGRLSNEEAQRITGITKETATVLHRFFPADLTSSTNSQQYKLDPEENLIDTDRYDRSYELNRVTVQTLLLISPLYLPDAVNIVRYRQKIGGFQSVSQLLEIRSLSLEDYAVLRRILVCTVPLSGTKVIHKALYTTRRVPDTMTYSALRAKHLLTVANNLDLAVISAHRTGRSSIWTKLSDLPAIFQGPDYLGGYIRGSTPLTKKGHWSILAGRYRLRTGTGLLMGVPENIWIDKNPLSLQQFWNGPAPTAGFDEAYLCKGGCISFSSSGWQLHSYFSKQKYQVSTESGTVTRDLYAILSDADPLRKKLPEYEGLKETLTGIILSRFPSNRLQIQLHATSAGYSLPVSASGSEPSHRWFGLSGALQLKTKKIRLISEAALTRMQTAGPDTTVGVNACAFKSIGSFYFNRFSFIIELHAVPPDFIFPRSGHGGTHLNDSRGGLLGMLWKPVPAFRFSCSVDAEIRTNEQSPQMTIRANVLYRKRIWNFNFRIKRSEKRTAAIIENSLLTGTAIELSCRNEFRSEAQKKSSSAASLCFSYQPAKEVQMKTILSYYRAQQTAVYPSQLQLPGWYQFPSGTVGRGSTASAGFFWRMTKGRLYFNIIREIRSTSIEKFQFSLGGEFLW